MWSKVGKAIAKLQATGTPVTQILLGSPAACPPQNALPSPPGRCRLMPPSHPRTWAGGTSGQRGLAIKQSGRICARGNLPLPGLMVTTNMQHCPPQSSSAAASTPFFCCDLTVFGTRFDPRLGRVPALGLNQQTQI